MTGKTPSYITEWLSKHGKSEIDGPPDSSVTTNHATQRYVTIEAVECDSQSHAERVFLKRLADFVMQYNNPIVVWRTRPEFMVDEFGLYAVFARLTTIGAHEQIQWPAP